MVHGLWAKRPLLGYTALVWLALSVTYWVTRGQDSTKVGGDGHYHVLLALSVVEDGDLSMADEYRSFGDPYRYGIVDGVAGAPFSLGPGITMVPLMAVAKLWYGEPVGKVKLYGPMGKLAAYTAVFLTTGTFFFLIAIGSRFVSPHEASVLSAMSILGLPLFFYTIFHPTYTHCLTGFGCAFTVWAALRWRESPSMVRAMVMGAAVGIAGLGRTQYLAVAFFCIALTTELAVSDPKRRLVALRDLMIAGATSIAVVSTQLLLWLPAGHDFGVPVGEHYMHLEDPAWWMILFSSRNGLFPWSPLAWFGGLGIIWLTARRPALGAASLCLFASMWWINASAWDWHSSWGFGARRFSSCAVLLLLGLLGMWTSLQSVRLRRGAAVLAVVLTLLSAGLALNQGQTNGRTDINMPMLSTYAHGLSAWVLGAGERYQSRRSALVNPIVRLLQPLYDVSGNPFSFPAPWLVRWQTGLAVASFDRQWGRALLERSFHRPWPASLRYWGVRALVLPVDSGFKRVHRGVSLAGKGRALLPMFMRECVRVQLEVQGAGGKEPDFDGISMTLNGAPVGGPPTRAPNGFSQRSSPMLFERGYAVLEVESDEEITIHAVELQAVGQRCPNPTSPQAND